MPRPSLTEEMPACVAQLADRIREALDFPLIVRNAAIEALAFDVQQAFKSRLTALETELEGYRKDAACRRLCVEPMRASDSVGRANPVGVALPCTTEYVNAQTDREHE